ncbi:hypothetical protein FRC15_011950 [Serendipita sp. 397]|nr:hypothetical protein FRC15_011950 [Serendipita sp. 397]
MELDANADVQANPSINQAVEMNLEVKNAIEAAMNDTFNMFAATMDSGEREPKLVVAHHMVGNTYPYTVEDWKRDIQLASSHSIDGFVLNVGRDDWMTARVDDAYAAAQSVGNGFKLCLSLDMTSLPCATLQDVQTLQHWVSRYAHHPNQLIYRGKPLVSTFAGEGCTYGGSFATAWTEFKKGLGGNIHFVPSLFTNPAILNTLPFLDGIFNWNGAWVDGFDHQGWLEMTSYYAQAFKTGSFPVIAEDKVFVWARPHPKDASAPDHVPRPQFADLTDDFFWVVIFAKSPATAILHAPPPNSDSNSVDHNAAMIVDIPAGVHKLRYPLLPGRTMAVRLERSGNVDLDYRADGFVFNPSPNVYNFNAWVGWKTGS